MLKHDDQGFLVGEPLDVAKTISVLASIRADVAAIRRSVLGSLKKPFTDSGRTASVVPVSLPQGRGQPGNVVSHEKTAVPKGREEQSDRPLQDKRGVAIPNVKLDNRGRFQGDRNSGHGNTPDSVPDAGEEQGGLKNAISNLTSAVLSSADGMEQVDPAVAAFQEVAQPLSRGYEAIFGGNKEDRWYRRIWKEIKSFRVEETGLSRIAGKWLKKIKDKNAPSGTEGGGFLASLLGFFGLLIPLFGSGLTGIFTGILSFLTGGLSKLVMSLLSLLTGGITRLFSSLMKFLPFGGTAAGGAGAGGAAGGANKKGGGGKGKAGRFFKRVPVLGTLLALGMGAGALYDSETDEATTRREKDKNGGKIVGGLGGALAGGAAGASMGGSLGAALGSIVPGLGTVIGGVLGTAVGGIAGMFLGESAGEIIGEKVGEWVNDLRNSDIGNTAISMFNLMKDDFNAATEWFKGLWDGAKAGWDAAVESFTGLWDSAKAGWDATLKGISDAWGSAKNWVNERFDQVAEAGRDVLNKTNDTIKEATGIDVAETAQKVLDKTSEAIDGIKDGVSDAANTALGWVGDRWNNAKQAVGRAGNYVADVTAETGRAAISRVTGDASKNRKAVESEMVRSGITDVNEQALFMATMHHESAGFTRMEENLNYRSADRLMSVNSNAKRAGKERVNAAIAAGPEAVGELLYGGRKDLGNTEAGDGYRFRGRGAIGLTGRANYDRAGKALGLDLVSNPDLAADPAVAAKVATWYWKDRKGLSEAAKGGDVERVRKLVNGGYNGLGDVARLSRGYQDKAASGEYASVSVSPVQVAAAVETPVAPTFTGATMPSIPSPHPQLPSPGNIPPVPVGSMSSGERKPQVIVQNGDIGQDLSDRRIAHVVTGGLS